MISDTESSEATLPESTGGVVDGSDPTPECGPSGSDAKAPAESEDEPATGAEPGRAGDVSVAERDVVRTGPESVVQTGSSHSSEHKSEVHVHVLGSQDTKSTVSGAKPAVDPTQPTKSLPSQNFTFARSTVEEWHQVLVRERLLMISCCDEQLLLAAGVGVANLFAPHIRLLRFKEEVRCREEASELTFDSLLDPSFEWTQGSVLVAQVTRTATAATFRDSVARYAFETLGAQAALENRGAYLLLLSDSDPGADASIPSRRVPFLVPLLSMAGHGERSEELAETLERQRREGFWSESDDDFRRQLLKHLNGGTLEEAIGSPPERRAPVAPQIVPGDSLANAALFLASYYPPLPVEDFHRLLSTLVAGEVKREVKTVFELDEAGVGSSHEVAESIPLEQIARDRYDELYTRCGLVVTPATGETTLDSRRRSMPRGPVVELERPERAEQVRRELASRHYLTLVQLFERIAEAQLVLDYSLPVVRGTIDVVRTMASTDSLRFGVPVLVGLLDRARQDPLNRGPILARLYLLLREFPDDPVLSAELDRLLNELIGGGRQEEALELVKRLRFAAGFDHIAWWKQLLARSDPATRSETLDEIWSTLHKDRTQLPQTVRRLGGWLPPPDQPVPVRVQPHLLCANEILFQVQFKALQQSLFRRFSSWPPEDPLHAALLDLEHREEELPLLEWMFHPGVLDGQKLFEVDDDALPKVLVWWWLIPPPDLAGGSELGSPRWLEALFERPEDARALVSPACLQAFVLADLALGVEQVEDAGTRASALDSLRRVVAVAKDLATARGLQQDLLACWSRLQDFASRVLDFGDEAGIQPEQRQRMAPRLRVQFRALKTLLTMFRSAGRPAAKPAGRLGAATPAAPVPSEPSTTSEETLVL